VSLLAAAVLFCGWKVTPSCSAWLIYRARAGATPKAYLELGTTPHVPRRAGQGENRDGQAQNRGNLI
jgi:hypothetical protein